MATAASLAFRDWRIRARVHLAESFIGRKIFQPRGAEDGEVFLNQRRVFILPTRAGLILASMLVALLLGSINYSLSLGFALTFLVVGVAWIGMLATFRNLAHLYLRPLRVDPVFAGDAAEFRIVLRSAAAFDRYAILLAVDGLARPVPCDLGPGCEVDAIVPVVTTGRGRQAMPRVTLATTFPVGLWRAWAHYTPRLAVLVYPRPARSAGPPPWSAGLGREEQRQHVRGSDDFAGLRAYVAGDAVRHIAWRAMARNPEGRVMTKLFDGGASGEASLDFDVAYAQTAHVEDALSLLTRWVLDAETQTGRYALTLPGRAIASDRGPVHCAVCLEALALASP